MLGKRILRNRFREMGVDKDQQVLKALIILADRMRLKSQRTDLLLFLFRRKCETVQNLLNG